MAVVVIDTGRFFFRGVHARHPALSDALLGVVKPANSLGSVTATEHNRGGVSGISPFTSWTTEFGIALGYAMGEGSGGVILRVPSGPPRVGAL